MRTPRAFVSYSWDNDHHKCWVLGLATRLRGDGVDVTLDQWAAVPGDDLPSFMEKEIRENDYVLIICTPDYRLKSDHRQGGVGYEGDVMTAEVYTKRNHRKFIPILSQGTWEQSSPTWLKGKYYLDLSTEALYNSNYADLTATLLGTRPVAPQVGRPGQSLPTESLPESAPNEPLRIVGIILDEVTEPRLDGTEGSALYTIPFRLNGTPSPLWCELFLATWDSPPRFSTMHRPRIASVRGDRILLAGTTMEEVSKYHRDTLVLCVDSANAKEAETLEAHRIQQENRRRQLAAHRREVEDLSRDISFE